MDNRIPKEEWADFLAPFKCQLTVCWPKLSDAQGFAKQTVHYFCRLVKGADFFNGFAKMHEDYEARLEIIGRLYGDQEEAA
jgi:hypothetical protein